MLLKHLIINIIIMDGSVKVLRPFQHISFILSELRNGWIKIMLKKSEARRNLQTEVDLSFMTSLSGLKVKSVYPLPGQWK